MANVEHVAVVRQGTEAIRQYREQAEREVIFDLREADFRGLDLVGADLVLALLGWADLTSANLTNANLGGADLHGVRFVDANLSGANLREANLYKTRLAGTKLVGAMCHRAQFVRCELTNADLSDATCLSTIFADTDLSVVKGLEDIQHDGPSTIGIDAIYRSKGNIPKAFLQGCGVTDDLLSLLDRSILSAKSPPFYSCFSS